jgi:rhodanese-related sulfurtransferase
MAYRISPKELELEEDEYYVIDVREADELEEGKIRFGKARKLEQAVYWEN